MVFLYNTECAFDKKTQRIDFDQKKSLKWKIPIQSVKLVEMIDTPGKKIELKIYTDLAK